MKRLTVIMLLLLTTLCSVQGRAATRLTATERFRAAGVELPLKSEQAQVTVEAQIARTVVTSVFENSTDQRLETRFVATLPPDAVVVGFAYWFKGQRIEATVEEKEWARWTYESIVSGRRDPALGTRTDSRTFSATVFPVEPKSELRMELRCVQLLPMTKNGTVLYHYPLLERHGVRSLPTDKPLPRFEFALDFNHHRPLRSLRCSVPQAHTKANGKQGTVTLMLTDFTPSDDLEIIAETEAADEPACVMTPMADGMGYFLLLCHAAKGEKLPLPQGNLRWALPYPLSNDESDQQAIIGEYLGNPPTSQAVRVSPATPLLTHALPRLWAHAYVKRLAAKLDQHQVNEIRLLAVQTSRQFVVESPYTAFLAIPESERPRWMYPWRPFLFAPDVPGEPVTFPDPLPKWVEGAVKWLGQFGVMEGYPDGTFKGHHTMTRYEGMIAIARSLDKFGRGRSPRSRSTDNSSIKNLPPSLQQQLKTRENSPAGVFRDVPTTHWSYEYYRRLAEMRLISGDPDGMFYGKRPLTRYELAKVVTEILLRFPPAQDIPAVPLLVEDVSPQHWAYPFVLMATRAGVMEGYPDGTFRGDKSVTRSELAMVMFRLMVVEDMSPTIVERSHNLSITVPNWVSKVTVVNLSGQRIEMLRYFRTWSGHVPDNDWHRETGTALTVRLEGIGKSHEYVVHLTPSIHQKLSLQVRAALPPDMVLAWGTWGELTELYAPVGNLDSQGALTLPSGRAPWDRWLALAFLYKSP